MYIVFDDKNVHVQVMCGSLEEYKPSRKIKLITEKTQALKKQMSEFMEEVVNPELESIKKMVEEENNKQHKNQEK